MVAIQNPKDSTIIAVGETYGLKIIELKHCNPKDSTIIAVGATYGLK